MTGSVVDRFLILPGVGLRLGVGGRRVDMTVLRIKYKTDAIPIEWVGEYWRLKDIARNQRENTNVEWIQYDTKTLYPNPTEL